MRRPNPGYTTARDSRAALTARRGAALSMPARRQDALLAVVLIALLGAMTAAAAKPDPSNLHVSFDATGVVVTGVTPGASVVFFSVARESKTYYSNIVRRQTVLVDDKRVGTVRYDLGRDVPRKSIWAVVDLTSGDYTVVPAPQYQPDGALFSASQLKNDNAGQLSRLTLQESEAEMLLVRPGAGAWNLRTARGLSTDKNRGHDGGLEIDMSAMTAVSGSAPPPDHYIKGDVIVMINPRWMRYFAARVGE